MRLVILDDGGALRAWQRCAEAAGIAVADGGLLHASLPTCDRAALRAQLLSDPPPHMALVHRSVLGDGADEWLGEAALPAQRTLLIAHSGASDHPADARTPANLWTCGTTVLLDRLTPFLEACLPLLGPAWPGNVDPAQLNEASWQATAVRHILGFCQPLAEAVMRAETDPQAVRAGWDGLERQLTLAGEALAESVPRAAPGQPTLRQVLGCPDAGTELAALWLQTDAIRDALARSNLADARRRVCGLQQRLATAIGV